MSVWNMYQSQEADGTTCVFDEEKRFEYAELDGFVEAFRINLHFHIESKIETAISVSELGIRYSGISVGIFLPNGIERLTAILGLSKMGIPWTPLVDQSFTKEMRQHVMKTAGVTLVLHTKTEKFSAKWELLKEDVAAIDVHDMMFGPSARIMLPNADIKADNLWCTYFKKLNTASPVRVSLTNKEFISHVDWYTKAIPYNKTEISCNTYNFMSPPYVLGVLADVLTKQNCLLTKYDTTCFEFQDTIKKQTNIMRLTVPLKGIQAFQKFPAFASSVKHVISASAECPAETTKALLQHGGDVVLSFYRLPCEDSPGSVITLKTVAGVEAATVNGIITVP